MTEDGGKTWTKTFKDVPADTYTVTETNALIDGYKLKDTSETTATAEVKDGQTATAEITDEYEKETPAEKKGSLELTKTIKGDVTEEEAEGALVFVIRTSDGKYLKADGTRTSSRDEAKLTLKDFEHKAGTKKYTLKIKGIAAGSYTVTETTKDINGKDVTVTYQVDGGKLTKGDSAAFDIRPNETTHVAYEDAYTVRKDDGSGTPKTGDESPIAAWTALLVLSALGMAFAIKIRKKEDEA